MYFFLKRQFFQDLNRIGFLLVPLRLFMGIGWIRAGVEKFMNPKWASGEALLAWFDKNQTFSPFYQVFVDNIFIPYAEIMANIISTGQFMAGVAIFFGIFTNIALLAAIFMNLNFVLMGATLPSAFYIIIQIELFLMDTGSMVGFDAILHKKVPYSFICSRPFKHGKNLKLEKASYLIAAIFCLAISFIGLSQVKHLTPHAVHDPEMIFFVMNAYMAFGFGITLHRLRRGVRKEYKSYGLLQFRDQNINVLTLDLSYDGISFLVPKDCEKDLLLSDSLSITLQEPISGKGIKLTGVINNITGYGRVEGLDWTRVGINFSKTNRVKSMTSRFLQGDIETLIQEIPAIENKMDAA